MTKTKSAESKPRYTLTTRKRPRNRSGPGATCRASEDRRGKVTCPRASDLRALCSLAARPPSALQGHPQTPLSSASVARGPTKGACCSQATRWEGSASTDSFQEPPVKCPILVLLALAPFVPQHASCVADGGCHAAPARATSSQAPFFRSVPRRLMCAGGWRTGLSSSGWRCRPLHAHDGCRFPPLPPPLGRLWHHAGMIPKGRREQRPDSHHPPPHPRSPFAMARIIQRTWGPSHSLGSPTPRMVPKEAASAGGTRVLRAARRCARAPCDEPGGKITSAPTRSRS